MKITFFVHRYWPSVGGVEKYVHELAKALLALGHEVSVVAGATQERLPDHSVFEGVKVHRFPALRSPLRCRLWLWRNYRLFTQADVIHVSNTHMLEYLWRMMWPALDRRKVFLTRHGMSYRYPVPEMDKQRAVQSLRHCAGVAHDGAFIEKWLGVKPDICPPQGLFPRAAELPAVPAPPPTSAVFIGRLEEDSGIRIYLDGVRLLHDRHQGAFTLHVYGDGPLGPALRAQMQRDRLRVVFHGRVADAQRHLVDGAFAFLDGRMAIQEAFARRRPVVAAYATPLKKDYVGGEYFSPYLVPVGSGAELAERVTYLASHPNELRDQTERAYAFACTLSWERTAEEYLDFWRSRLGLQVRPAGEPQISPPQVRRA